MHESKKNPKVFISYSHDSEIHKDRVLALSDRLRADGIDCIIDQYEISPPEGWARWCNNRVEEADFVLVVSLGKNHPNVATVLKNLAALLRKTNHEAEAQEMEERTMAILGGGEGN